MIHVTHVTKMVVLALISAIIGSALAATGSWAAEWKIEPKAGEVIKITETDFDSGEKDSAKFAQLTKIGGQTVEIACEKVSAAGELKTDGSGAVTVSFSTCSTFINGTLVAACKPAESLEAKVKIEQFLHTDGLTYMLFSPANGTTFVTVKLGEGECSVGEKFEVKGSAVMEDCNHELSKLAVKHLFQQVASTTLFSSGAHVNSLKLGANAVTMDGSLWLSLLGKLAGIPWMGVA